MNCTNHQAWLQEYLDGTPPADSTAAEQHRTSCAVCCQLFAAAQRMLAALHRAVCPAPPAELPERIVQAVIGERQRSLRIQRITVLGAALAASLLLTISLVAFSRRPTDQPVRPVQFVENAKLPETSLGEDLQEAATAVVAITRRTTDETVGQTRLLTVLVPEVPMPDAGLLVATNSPSVPLRELQEGVSDGLEPVTTSWRRALDLFRQNLPTVTPASE